MFSITSSGSVIQQFSYFFKSVCAFCVFSVLLQSFHNSGVHCEEKACSTLLQVYHCSNLPTWFCCEKWILVDCSRHQSFCWPLVHFSLVIFLCWRLLVTLDLEDLTVFWWKKITLWKHHHPLGGQNTEFFFFVISKAEWRFL